MLGGFLNAAMARGQLTEKEILSWLNDAETLDAAGLFNDGVIVFTASGEKARDGTNEPLR
jgi:hypothetical protein